MLAQIFSTLVFESGFIVFWFAAPMLAVTLLVSVFYIVFDLISPFGD